MTLPRYLISEFRPVRVAIVLIAIALIAGVWALTFERIAYERADAVQDVVRQNTNLAKALEERTVRAVKAAGQAALFVKWQYERDGRISDLKGAIFGEQEDSFLKIAGIVDAKGDVFLANGKRAPVNAADREYFIFHRDHPSGGLFISAALHDRVNGGSTILFTRRLDSATGAFAGAAVVAMQPAYLLSSFEDLDLGPEGMVQVLGLDGFARARRHGGVTTFGDDMRKTQIFKLAQASASGDFTTRGSVDGVTRYESFRRLKDYPLIVGVGVSTEHVVGHIASRQRYYYASAAAASAAILLIAVGLFLWLRAQQRSAGVIRESEERFRQMAENIRDVFFLQNLDSSQMYYVSPAYEQVWGRTCESLYANPMSWAEAIHPDDAADASRKFVEGRESDFDYEFRIVRPDGDVRWIRVRGFAIRDEHGTPYRTAGLAMDITRRKAAEQVAAKVQAQYRATFDQAAVGVTHTSLDGRFVNANRKLCEMLRYSEAELHSLRFVDITHPDDVPPSRELMKQLVADPTQRFLPPIDKRYVRKDGTVLWATVAAAIVRDEQGAAQYFVTTILDITAQKEAEARLIEQLDELRRFQRVTVGRELRMVELEDEIRSLRQVAHS